MTRSERLAQEGKVDVNIGTLEIASVIKDHSELPDDARYIGTDYECIYDGKIVWADVYMDNDNKLYAYINNAF